MVRKLLAYFLWTSYRPYTQTVEPQRYRVDLLQRSAYS